MAEPLLKSDLSGSTDVPGARGPGLELPPGYDIHVVQPGGSRPLVASPRAPLLSRGGRTLILRRDLRDKLLRAGISDPERIAAGPLVVDWIEGGRTRHALIETEGEAWVLKAYRRGGVVGTLNSVRYWGARRFLEELNVASRAGRMGVATAEVLALVLEPAGFGSLRAWLVSRYLEGVRPLYEFFDDGEMLYAAGELVARMHGGGIDHPDLHLGNIVGRFDGPTPNAFIIDWDRARHRAAGTWNPYGNLIRLWRSVEKGRRQGQFRCSGSGARAPAPVSARSLRAFVRGYFKGRPAALREARRYFRRRALVLELRTLFWRTDRG